MSGKTVTVIGPTDKNGYAKSKEINYGYYRVEETKVPENYQAGEVTEWNVEVSDDVNGLITLDITNDRQYGSVKVIKSAEDNFKENLTFSLKGTSVYGDYISLTVATDAAGIALFDHVPIGTGYVLSEENTPERYVIPDEQQVTVEWNKVTERDFDNILKKWCAEVYKLDEETRNIPQGDATLAGAVYGVYKGGQLIDTYTTDANGHFITNFYVCSTDYDWTIREISPSEGYLLDDTVHFVGADPQKYDIELNTVEMSVFETVKEGDVAIIKHTDDGSTQIETPEEGATFEMYLKKAGYYANAKESERDILVCDENGFAQSKLVPYGIYTLHQISGWEGREFLHDFDVFIEKDHQTYRYLINNADFESYIKVVKTDAESGLPIPYAGAEFQIYDPDGNLVVMSYTYPTYTEISIFRTNSEGYLITPQCLPYGKGYSLVEVNAPYGYVLNNDPVYFDVAADTAAEDGPLTVVVVTRPNMPQKGVIHISKTGEVFQSVVQTGGIYKPVYEIKGLAGAVYEIYAAEDIQTPDGTLRYTKGELVDTVTTGADGVGTSKELYLGSYEIKETKAPHGMILNSETKTVELVYAGQDVAVTETSASFYNDRQKVETSLRKQLEQNELFGIGMNEELADITFGLYAAEDLIAGDGSKIPAGGLIEIVTFDADGNAVCKTDLPLGSYYLQERSTNAHYILNTHKYDFTFDYAGQEIPTVELQANGGEPIPNELKYGSVSGLKIDEDGETIEGALFGLFRNDETEFTEDTALLTAVSDKGGRFRFEDIPYGTWIVRELKPAEGFVMDENSYPVNVEKDGEVIEIQFENRYIRGDILGHKVDEDGAPVVGALFGLFLPDDTEFTEENAVLTAVSDEDGNFLFEQVRYGDWLVKELFCPEQYVLSEEIYEVTVSENEETLTFTAVNRHVTGKARVVKINSGDHNQRLSGAAFEIYLDVNSNQVFEPGVDTLIGDLTECEPGVYETDPLRYNGYFLFESKAPDGFQKDDRYFYFRIQKDGETVTIENEIGVGFTNRPISVPGDPTSPKTGDNSHILLWILLASGSLAALIVCVTVGRKNRKVF